MRERTEHLSVLTVTTPTHAFALTTYWGQFVLGLAYLTGSAEAVSMTTLAGTRIVAIWAFWLMLSALVCGLAARATGHANNPRTGLRIEMWGVASMGLASLALEVTLYIANGFGAVLATQILASTVFVGAFFRVLQIRKEMRRLDAALAHIRYAAPPLAEPPSSEG